MALLVLLVDNIAHHREVAGLLTKGNMNLVTDSTSYCFAVTLPTLTSLMLVELKFRKPINFLQYILVACALLVFFLLLTAMSEPFKFVAAYIIVSAMTIGLLAWFVNGMMRTRKATILISAILAVEYGIILLLLYMGTLSLLVGSLILFAILALAMYFTLRLKTENQELILK